MILSETIGDFILSADHKALATNGQSGLNVVPVSTIRIKNGKIILVNYFMNKTLTNILENPLVALACWRGLAGYQIKGTVVYYEQGELVEEIKNWVKEILPDRQVLGVLELNPVQIFDLSAQAQNPGAEIK